jgi:hypothetical protein
VLPMLAAVGCGGAAGTATPPKPPPKLPHALAQAWAEQADAVAASLAAGDGCTAENRAVALRTQVVDAVNSHRIARRYLEPLMSAANALPGRIRCTPPAPLPTPEKHGHGHPHPHPHAPPHHGHHGKPGKH